jgi:hypothetical protein
VILLAERRSESTKLTDIDLEAILDGTGTRL